MTTDAYAVTTKLEQQINIINQEFSTSNTTASPTDNSLGMFEWWPDAYTGETVYFEAVLYCDSCSGNSATVSLYTDSGGSVTGGGVSTTSTSYTRLRSGEISGNLTSGEEYTVRLTAPSGGTAYLQTSRLIVIQDNDPISQTVTHVELGNNTTTTSTSYSVMTGPVIYWHDSQAHTDLFAVNFEATLQGSDGSATSYAILSSSGDCAATVSGSELTITGTTWDRAISGDIKANLTDDTEYFVCTKTTSGDTGSIANAKLIYRQNNSNGLNTVETYQQYINHPLADSDSTYTSQSFFNEFNPANFAGDIVDYFFEATLLSNSGTGYANLFNTSDTTAITGSEVSHNANSYARKRSQLLTANMPSATKTLDSQLKNGASNTTTASSSWLIVRVDDVLDASMSFEVTGTLGGQVFNEITTSTSTVFPGISFGNLTVNIPRYASHKLYVETNAPEGYSVTSRIVDFMQGLYPANNFDGFIAPWNAPTTWTEPTGLIRNQDTGWIGANTTDTRVPNWTSGAAQKFGVVNNTAHTVMTSTSEDSGTTVYVTYAVEANYLQPADSYAGSIIYEILPTY